MVIELSQLLILQSESLCTILCIKLAYYDHVCSFGVTNTIGTLLSCFLCYA